MSDPYPYKRRSVLHWAALVCFIFGGTALGVWQVMVHPDTPLRPEWNPLEPLIVTDPVTSLTQWKLRRALGDDTLCLAAISTGAQVKRKPDFIESTQCGIVPQVVISGIGNVRISPVNTRCQTALRLTMWTQHSLQPAAQDLFSQELTQIDHFSSYSCCAMRTSSGETGRMSTHATADSIDISGFELADGTQLSLLRDWDGLPKKAAFLRQANAGACAWFRVTLGPNYNSLHADHFHLQHTGFGLCN
jgi:hypothetical protein